MVTQGLFLTPPSFPGFVLIHSLRASAWLTLSIVILFLPILPGCSSSKEVVEEGVMDDDDESFADAVVAKYIWIDATSSILKSNIGDEINFISSGGKLVYSSVSGDGTAIVFGVENDGRVQLNYVDMVSGGSRSLQAARTPVIFTGAWSPDSKSFAFGYYVPLEGQGRNTIGEGEIKVVSTTDGQVRNIRCSASQAVVAWPEAGTLMVRNNDNMYGVSPTDCSTQITVDIRKWHHIKPSPDGSKLAYILRDLAYNRDSQKYEPDSMLYVVNSGEIEGTLVVGDRYRPRNIAWSDNSAEIAFDVLERLDSDKRVVFIYQIEEEKRFVLNDPSEQNPSESHPAYFYRSNSLSYVADGERLMIGGGSLMVEQITVGDDAGPWLRLAGWLDRGKTAVIKDAAGNLHAYDMRTKESSLMGAGDVAAPGRRLR